MAAYISLSSSTSTTETKVTITVTMYYHGNGVSYSNVARTCKITFNGSTKTFSHTFTTSTSSQRMGSATFTYTRDHGTHSFKPSGSLDASNTSLGKLTKTGSAVSIPAKASYTITYWANNGSGAPSPQTKWYGETLILSSQKPTRTGYTFKGWGTSESATSVAYAAGGSYTNNESANLYAVWSKNTYVLTYNANGGSLSTKSVKRAYGATYGTLPTPTRTGYTLKGWYTAASGGTQVYSSTTMGASNVTIYAQWTPITYSVKFNANGGTGSSMSNESFTYGTAKALTANGFSRSGYSFKGWAKTSSGAVTYTNKQSVKNLTTVSGTVINLYAVWSSDYESPSILNINAYRCDSSGNERLSGDYVKVSFEWTAASLGSSYKASRIVVSYGDTSLYDQTSSSGEGTVEVGPFAATLGEESTLSITVTDTQTTSGDYDTEVHIDYPLPVGGLIVHISPDEKCLGFLGFAPEGGDGLYIKNRPLLDLTHPVGSTLVTTTNTNPGSTLGGTWVLYDKQFKQRSLSSGFITLDNFTLTGTDTGNTYAIFDGHTVRIRLRGYNTVAIGESAITIGTLNKTKIGVASGKDFWAAYPVAWTDGGNAVIMFNVNGETGIIQTADVVSKTSGGSVAANSWINFDFFINITQSSMADDCCDKFFWRRTS